MANLQTLVDEYSALLAEKKKRPLTSEEQQRFDELRDVVLETGAGAEADPYRDVRTPRAQVSVEVSFNTAQEAARAYTRDVGSGGLALLTDKPLPKGSCVSLKIRIPSWETPLETDGEVIWVDSTAMGIAFRGTQEADLKRIKELIAENTTFLSRLSTSLGRRKAKPAAARISSPACVLLRLTEPLLADATLELLLLHKYPVIDGATAPAGTQPSVVIVDLHHLADAVERYSGTPIILVNASGPDALTGKLIHVRPVAFLKRPVSPARILQVLRGVQPPK
jgi:uncharacterized protein (TIGR02266 family)